MRLTEHFTLEELTHSDTALRLGIDNTPPAEILPHITATALGMQRVRLWLGHPVIVHSGFRCEALERVLCDKDYRAWCARHGRNVTDDTWAEYFARKAHPRGYACDFTCPGYGAPAHVVAELAHNSGIAFDQLIEEGRWVHASFDPRQRGEVLVARFDAKGVPSYSRGGA